MELGKIYLDNAATTPLHPEVVKTMASVLSDVYGNPSATHSIGRQAKGVLETCRKKIAKHINASPNEIVFTSGGTEADNMAIRCAVNDLGVEHIITTPIEHKAVIDTAKKLEEEGKVTCHLLDVDEKGNISLAQLERTLEKLPNGLVTIMHANNEIGTINPIHHIASLCKLYGFTFHTDSVQTMAHLPIDVKAVGMDFLACSAHKFHGPKGVGFLYKKQGVAVNPMITGGGQESNTRAGTENIAGIAGMERAMELAFEDLEEEKARIQGLKEKLCHSIRDVLPEVEINGEEPGENSLFTVLSMGFPADHDALLLFKFDLQGLCVSGGSACNSGANTGSHVMRGIGKTDVQPVRFSFGRFSTEQDITRTIDIITREYIKV